VACGVTVARHLLYPSRGLSGSFYSVRSSDGVTAFVIFVSSANLDGMRLGYLEGTE